MAPSKLAGAPNCNEQLPVGDPDETYLFHQFMPIMKEETGATLQISIPLEVAYPQLVAWVRARSLPDEVERLGLLKKGTTPFVQKWKTAAVAPVPEIEDVYLPDLTVTLHVSWIGVTSCPKNGQRPGCASRIDE